MMIALSFLLLSLLPVARSFIIPDLTSGPSYSLRQPLPVNFVGAGTRQPLRNVQPIVLSALAARNSQSDDDKSVINTGKEIVARVAERVKDIIDNRKDVVDDLIGNVRDRVSDVIDKAKDIGTSQTYGNDSREVDVTKNETMKAAADADDTIEDSIDEDGGNSTENVKTSKEDDDDNKNKDDSRKNSSKQSTTDKKNKDDSNEVINDKNGRANNSTEDSGERHDNVLMDEKGRQSLDEDDNKNVWTWLKGLAGNDVDDSRDDETKVKQYLTQMSKVRGYLDAIDSSIAASQAKLTGTCPVYPVQVGQDRVTISTQNGCKIIIKLKGVTVDKIEDARYEHKTKRSKKSVLVSYASDD